jgi:hypothetical protein
VAKSNVIAISLKPWEQVQTLLTEENLPEQQDMHGVNHRRCIKELVEATSSCAEHLKNLQECCGFKDDAWEPDPESQIAKFLTALDGTVASKSSADFLKIVNEGVGGFKGRDFQHWFARLDGVLAQLRDAS